MRVIIQEIKEAVCAIGGMFIVLSSLVGFGVLVASFLQAVTHG